MADFDRVADIYDATRSIRPDIMKTILGGITKALRGTHSILDVGVGTGRFADPLRRRGFQVVGVDLSRLMMLKARDKGSLDLIQADAERLPLANDSFEAALMVHFLHLVKDWVKVLHELGRVASEYVLSVTQRVEGPRLRRVYVELREELGYPVKGLKWGEEELARLCPPLTSRPLAAYSDYTWADEEISEFESRIYHHTWDLPLNVHRRIIRRMKEEYAGKRLHRKHELRLVMWNPDVLTNFNPST